MSRQHWQNTAHHGDHEEPQADGRDGDQHLRWQRQAQQLVAGWPQLGLAAVPVATPREVPGDAAASAPSATGQDMQRHSCSFGLVPPHS